MVVHQKPYDVPLFDFGAGEEMIADGGAAAWRELCDKVRAACEAHGCFCLSTEKIPPELRRGMVEGLRQLFDLPHETKMRHVSPKPFRSYLGNNAYVPYLSSFGVDHAHEGDKAQAFTALMWPQGIPSFCEAMNEMSAKMLDLNHLVMKMLFTSYGLDADELSRSHTADTTSYVRLMSYKKVPAADHQSHGIGLVAHIDKSTITILAQNDVQGQEVQPKDSLDNDTWVPVVIPDGAFIVIVGDTLQAWSNGRLRAPKHRVVTGENKEVRYSWMSFLLPKDDSTIEAVKELVDEEHPLMYRLFAYADFLSYFMSNTLKVDAFEAFAGLSSPAGDRDGLAVE